MDAEVPYTSQIQAALQVYVETPSATADVTTILMVSLDGHHFALLVDGWDGQRHVNYCAVHIESCDGFVVIHQDRTDTLIDELIGAGISTQHIRHVHQEVPITP